MNNRDFDQRDITQQNSKLAQIREGMDVYDRSDHHIGSVDFVHFGAASETQQELGTGPATPGRADSVRMTNNNIVDWIADAFQPNEVPEELRERLMTNGFIRIDADGLFAADRFVTPDQIAMVSGDRVQLVQDKDDLIKRR